MTEPVAEQILEAVVTRVAAAFTDAHRSTKISTWQLKDWTTVVYQLGVTKNDEMSYPANPYVQGWTLECAIVGVTKPSDTDTVPIDRYKMRMAAEIVEAITDAANWHTWGGLAINSDIGAVEDYVSADGGHPGVAVRVAVHFRTPENNPYAVSA